MYHLTPAAVTGVQYQEQRNKQVNIIQLGSFITIYTKVIMSSGEMFSHFSPNINGSC